MIWETTPPHWIFLTTVSSLGTPLNLKLCHFQACIHNPVKNFSSQLAHWKLTWKLTASSFWSHSSTSQWIYKMSSHCDLTVSPLWVCNSHCEIAVSCLWDQLMSSTCSGSSELIVILLLTSRWDIQVSPGWVWPQLTCSLGGDRTRDSLIGS